MEIGNSWKYMGKPMFFSGVFMEIDGERSGNMMKYGKLIKTK